MSIPRYFDIDSSDYVPNEVLREFEWYPYNEDSNNVEGSTRYSIQTKNKSAMMRLSKARLEVKCQLVTDANPGAAPDSTKKIAPINSAWHLFSNVRALLNNQEIYNSPYTGKEHLIRHLVHYDKEYAKTVGSQVVFYPDTASDGHEYTAGADPIVAGHRSLPGVLGAVGTAGELSGMHNRFNLGKSATNTITTAEDNPNYNSGFKERIRQFIESEGNDGANPPVAADVISPVTLWLPLSEVIPFFADYDRLMTGVTFQLILNKNTTHESYLFGDGTDGAGATERYRIDITGLKLWVPEIEPSREIEPQIIEKFLSSSRMITYRDVVGYKSPTYTGGGRAGTQSWNVATTVSKPLKAYVAFQYVNRETQYVLNGGEFDLLYNTIGLRVNGQYLPNTQIDIEADEPTKKFNFARVLQEIHRAGGKDIDSDDSAIITHQNWRDIYPIVVFDLEDRGEGLFKQNLAHIVLEWTKRNTKANGGAGANLGDYCVYMILETERGLKLDYTQSRLNVLFK